MERRFRPPASRCRRPASSRKWCLGWRSSAPLRRPGVLAILQPLLVPGIVASPAGYVLPASVRSFASDRASRLHCRNSFRRKPFSS